VENLRLWLKADTLTTGTLGGWPDQSGLGNAAIAPTLAAAPTVTQDDAGNRTVRFDATKSQHFALPAALMTGASEGEAFIVLKAASAQPSAVRGLWRMGYSNYNYYPNTNGTLTDHFGTNTSRSLGAPVADIAQWHVYNVSSNAGEWTARINGITQYTVAGNTVYWNSSPLLGYNGCHAFDGEIAEVLVFDRVLTEGEREALGEYASAKYPLTGVDEPGAAPVLRGQAAGNGQNYLEWDAPAEESWTGYVLERSTNGGESGGWEIAGRAGIGARSYLDQGLAAGTYYYRVKARTWAGETGGSNEVALTVSGGSAPVVPVEGMRLWLRADLGIAADSAGVVSRWGDISGSGNHAAQAVAASRPALAAAPAPDARPVVRFVRASQQKLELPAGLMTGASAGDAFVILRNNALKPASHS
jgi:hypothetical protein